MGMFYDPAAYRSPDERAARAQVRREWTRVIMAVLFAAVIAWGAVAGGTVGLWFAGFVVLIRLHAINERVEKLTEIKG